MSQSLIFGIKVPALVTKDFKNHAVFLNTSAKVENKVIF